MIDVLEKHGTKAFVLPPTAIITAAERDIATRTRRGELDPGEIRYAFDRRHVRRAKSVKQLLEIALKDSERGEDSAKKSTRLIYCEDGLLEAALAIVMGREAMG